MLKISFIMFKMHMILLYVNCRLLQIDLEAMGKLTARKLRMEKVSRE